MAVNQTAKIDRTSSPSAAIGTNSKTSITPQKEPPHASQISLEQFKTEITKRAEENYRKRQQSNISGDALSDWLTAEKEIKAKHRIS